ncbi:MAG TPA: CocE/NonD family hydrolase [Rhizomicrobium sp.]
MDRIRFRSAAHLVAVISAMVAISCAPQKTAPKTSAPFAYQQVMIPMRDGARLQTVIFTPKDHSGPLPILLTRTPYGVPDKAPAAIPEDLKALARDGYIFVFQNVRGRFKSEGVFRLSSIVDPEHPDAPNDVTDAYDTITWLAKNIPNNNGRVGIYGISYAGFTSGVTLLDPPPALKAVSEQASQTDEWMNDDFHHYGALRESYTFEYSVMEEASKAKNTHFGFDTYDTYQWYLNLGPVSNIDAKYLHGSLPFWNDVVAHPDRDSYWQAEDWVHTLHGTQVAVLNVAGYWDQEDPWGPWQIFRHAGENGSDNDFMVAGPWYHGGWSREPKGDRIGMIPLGQDTSRQFRDDIQAPFFRYYLHGTGPKPDWQAKSFQTGSNSWHSYASWPPRAAKATNLYLHADGTLSFTAPSEKTDPAPYREYVSDPANPVPYRRRPISPTYPAGDWTTWEASDQSFVDHRPDVLTYVSAPLDGNVTITGALSAVLFASTSGTDGDFIVKLIDVYPDDFQKPAWDPEKGPKRGQYEQSLNGYELPIAMDVRRGRYLASTEHPAPLAANRTTEWDIPLRDHDHVFLKGHRIMVQVQSTWFPLIDRNPQKFVPSIYQAKAEDFVKATERVYSSAAFPSHIVLPLVAGASP